MSPHPVHLASCLQQHGEPLDICSWVCNGIDYLQSLKAFFTVCMQQEMSVFLDTCGAVTELPEREASAACHVLKQL